MLRKFKTIIKDTFNKMISYFDTDGVNEVEEEATDATEEVATNVPPMVTSHLTSSMMASTYS